MTDARPDSIPQEDFATLWESMGEVYDYKQLQRGDIREGDIVSIRPGEILFDIGDKQDAILSTRELQQMSQDELAALHVGAHVFVYMIRHDGTTGVPIVSLQMAREYEEWQDAQDLVDSGEIVRVRVVGYNKGGALASLGSLQGFIPASQIVELRRRGSRDRDDRDDALAEVVGRELAVKVIEVNRRRRRLILSERAARREWRASQRETLLEELAEGQVRKGVVSNVVDFGAFVDLGGMDGLVHLSELSWARVDHPSEVLDIGDEIEVLVLNVDRERQRIGLSFKRTQPDPWVGIGERYEAGQLVPGKVTHVVDFGAFVELEPGVEGLVHVSELTADDSSEPSLVVREGEELEFLVLGVEPDRHRISLSLAQADVDQSSGSLGIDHEQRDEALSQE